MKAVIVDLKGKYAAALTQDGQVRRIRDENYELGQSIELHELSRGDRPVSFRKIMKRAGTAAAAAVIVAALGGVTAYALPYGTVSVEGESGLEYTINCFDYVLSVKAVDEAGEAALSELDLGRIRHHKVETAISTTMEQLEKGGFLDENTGVAITAETKSPGHTQRLQQELESALYGEMGIPQREYAPAPETEQTAPGENPGGPEEPQGESAPSQPGGEDNPRQQTASESPGQTTQPDADGGGSDAPSQPGGVPDRAAEEAPPEEAPSRTPADPESESGGAAPEDFADSAAPREVPGSAPQSEQPPEGP